MSYFFVNVFFSANVLLTYCVAARNSTSDTPEMAAVRIQRDECFNMYRNLWEGKDGITFNKFPESVKQAIAVAMAKAPAYWTVEITQARVETQITNNRRKGKRKRRKEDDDDDDDDITDLTNTKRLKYTPSKSARSKHDRQQKQKLVEKTLAIEFQPDDDLDDDLDGDDNTTAKTPESKKVLSNTRTLLLFTLTTHSYIYSFLKTLCRAVLPHCSGNSSRIAHSNGPRNSRKPLRER